MNTKNRSAQPVEEFSKRSDMIIQAVEKAVIGKNEALRNILAALLTSGGHILIEDFPGLAKTLIANSFASALGLDFKRIQFTPDLLPGDITGGYVFDSNQNTFILRKGPLFTNFLLADEINRASPKTQSALLEAMQEYQVTLEGERFNLPEPFIVIATQNPIEYEGTFPLPEAQLDRFIMKLSVGYPSPEDEREILERRRMRKLDRVTVSQVVTPDEFLLMRQTIEEVFIHPDIERYIIEMVTLTRSNSQAAVGASPRGSLALFKLARSWAAMEGRNYVVPDDVKRFAQVALSHRLILEPSLWGTRNADLALIDEIIHSVPVPVLNPADE